MFWSSYTFCGQNKDETFTNGIRLCVCKQGFITVKNDCIKCGPNSVFNKDSVSCECLRGSINNNGQCIKCGINQVYDDVYKVCLCSNGTYKKDDGTCVTCPSRMVLIDNQCSCIFNYYEAGPGVCKPCLR